MYTYICTHTYIYFFKDCTYEELIRWQTLPILFNSNNSSIEKSCYPNVRNERADV